MTAHYHALRQLRSLDSKGPHFGSGDILVLFGELFQRGYANGLVEEAEKRGMTIIRTTVGRRDKDGSLRCLTAEESQQVPKPFINIPLEAGFDLEPDQNGLTPVDALKDYKLSDWKNATVSAASIEFCKAKGRERFLKNLRAYVTELTALIPPKKNVLFAHLMAGGVPRAKIIMPMMNRSLKGTGERFLSSEEFWQSPLGFLCQQSFQEVTAETFRFLIQETESLRNKIETSGGAVAYTAYGYHGTEVINKGKYQWQTYSPYLQGWAKKKLEGYAHEFSQKGIRATVYNCPEILTNSSAIFSGVEVSLYPLLAALETEGIHSSKTKSLLRDCFAKLKPHTTVESILEFTDEYLNSDLIKSHCIFEKWPQHNSKEQLEKMLHASEYLIGLHLDQKDLMTFQLSEVVLETCGQIMISDALAPESPVSWINHDVISKTFSQS